MWKNKLIATAVMVTLLNGYTYTEDLYASEINSVKTTESRVSGDIQVTSVTGNDTVINPDGSITVKAKIEGKNLSEYYIRIKAGTYINAIDNATINATKTEVDIEKTFQPSSIMGKKYELGVYTDYGRASEKYSILIADESTESSKSINGYTSIVDVDDKTGQVSIEVRNDTPQINNIDGSKSTVNTDGSVTIKAEISGKRLDNLTKDAVRIKAGSYNNKPDSIAVNSTGTVMTLEKKFNRSTLLDKEFKMFIVTEYGGVDEKTLPLEALKTTEDEVEKDGYNSYIKVDDFSKQILMGAEKINNKLTVLDQLQIPTYKQNQDVAAEKLVEDAGIVVTGDDVKITGYVNTDNIGNKLAVKITFTEQSGDREQITKYVEYNVTKNNIDLEIGDQKVIPTYKQNQDVTTEQLVEDAGIVLTGDDPYVGIQTVDTSKIGNKFKKTVLYGEYNGDEEHTLGVVEYNVENSTVDLNVEDQKLTPTYDQYEDVSSEKLVEDAGVKISGDTPIEITGTVSTDKIGQFNASITFTEHEGDKEQTTKLITYNVIDNSIDASEYFDAYSNDKLLPTFNENNEAELTRIGGMYGNLDRGANRGFFSKKQIDTSKPFEVEAFYQCFGEAFPVGDGKAISFYQPLDGNRNQNGGPGDNLGIINQNGTPFASKGVSITLDSNNADDAKAFTPGTGSPSSQYVEVVDMSQGEASNPVELYKQGGVDGLAIFDTYKHGWQKWNIKWTPYSITDNAQKSGKFNITVDLPYGHAAHAEDVMNFEYEVDRSVFPQGNYWMKISATTTDGGFDWKSTIEAKVKISDIDAKWVEGNSTSVPASLKDVDQPTNEELIEYGKQFNIEQYKNLESQSKEQAIEEQVTEEQKNEGQITEKQATEEQVTEEQVTEEQVTEEQVTEEQVTEEQTTEKQVTELD